MPLLSHGRLLIVLYIHLLHETHRHKNQNCQNQGNGTAEIPVSNRYKLGFDQITDQDKLPAAKELRNNERRNRRDSYSRGLLRGMAQGMGGVPHPSFLVH